MVKDLYDLYATEKEYETAGVWQDYGSARIKLARSGGKNTKYLKTIRTILKKYGKANWEAIKEEETDMILAEVFAVSVVKAWEIKNEKDEWESGIILMEKGKKKKVPFNIQNVKKCLLDLPDLFSDLRKYADDIKTFQKESEEEDLKN